MGRHRRAEPETGASELARLVRPIDGSSDEPSNPDLWGEDPYYDGDERPRKAAWALSLCLGIAFVVVGGLAFMFGASSADGGPKVVVQTEYVTPEPDVVTVTPKSQAKPESTKQRTKLVVSPGPTVYRTLPPKIVTRTVTSSPKPSVSIRAVPGPTVTACFEVWQGSIQDQIECP